ncbi:MAG: HEAT repeat domain-containing protein [Phycisphaerae bacterium]|nr:HEAT repeat domain-containing protein [Phycisphaerae bacterium]
MSYVRSCAIIIFLSFSLNLRAGDTIAIDASLYNKVYGIERIQETCPIKAGMTLDELDKVEKLRNSSLSQKREGLKSGDGWRGYWCNGGLVYYIDVVIEHYKVKSVWVMPGNKEWQNYIFSRISGQGDHIGVGRWKMIRFDFVLDMVKLLKEKGVEATAVKALESTDEAKVLLPEIQKLLKNKDADIRIGAIRAYKQTAPKRLAIQTLVSMLNDKSEKVRSDVAHLLRGYGADASVVCEELAKLAFTVDYSDLYQIPALFDDFDNKAKPAIPILLEALKSDSQMIKMNALLAFNRVGGLAKPAVEMIIELTRYENEDIRWRAVEALDGAGVENKDVTRAFADRLTDEAKPVKHSATYALGRMKRPPKEALPELIATIKRYHRTYTYGAEGICRALGNIGPEAKDAIPYLIAFLEYEGDDSLGVAAAEALAKMGKHAKDSISVLKKNMRNDFVNKYYSKAIKDIESALKE